MGKKVKGCYYVAPSRKDDYGCGTGSGSGSGKSHKSKSKKSRKGRKGC